MHPLLFRYSEPDISETELYKGNMRTIGAYKSRVFTTVQLRHYSFVQSSRMWHKAVNVSHLIAMYFQTHLADIYKVGIIKPMKRKQLQTSYTSTCLPSNTKLNLNNKSLA